MRAHLYVPRTVEDKFVVMDVETSMRSTLPNKASPFDPANELVQLGLEKECFGAEMVVGHNITFDINWYRRQFPHDSLNGLPVWDTQLAEYLLTGQQHSFASLDELCVKYGYTVKDDKVTAYFKEGKGAEHVPDALLSEYLEHDIKATRHVFECQIRDAEEKGMLSLIVSQMKALQATAEMQWNGIAFDKHLANHIKGNLEAEVLVLEDHLNNERITRCLWEGFSFLSNKQLHAFLYGGVLEEERVEDIGVYKTGPKMGTKKTKKVKVEHTLVSKTAWGGSLEMPTVDDKALRSVIATTPSVAGLLHTVLKHREVSKQLSTYFEGHMKCEIGGFVHPQYNHTVTKTGRLSSSGPNMQNVTSDGDIKKCYVSRWGKEGVLMEADYNQLEIVMLAHLSKDTQLIADLTSGVDMHTALYEQMYGLTPTTAQRKPFKRLSFGLVYGAGATVLSENAGCSLADAKKFIDVFYTRYPMVKHYHNKCIANAKAGRHTSDRKTKSGYPAGEYVQLAETGRRYIYTEYDAPAFLKARGEHTSFSPTELKNYPVQGGATGDIVPLALGALYEELEKVNSEESSPAALLVGTVHDSVLLDVKLERVPEIAVLVKSVLESAPALYKRTFDVEFSLPLKVGISIGKNWLEQEEYL